MHMMGIGVVRRIAVELFAQAGSCTASNLSSPLSHTHNSKYTRHSQLRWSDVTQHETTLCQHHTSEPPGAIDGIRSVATVIESSSSFRSMPVVPSVPSSGACSVAGVEPAVASVDPITTVLRPVSCNSPKRGGGDDGRTALAVEDANKDGKNRA
jgi:hypothetical protein